MIDYIFGEIVEKYNDNVVIENNNMGYLIRMPLRDLNDYSIGNSEKIFTRMIVREDDISLYGFKSTDSRILFDLLTTVSGIGPKVGIGILSNLTDSEIRTAILNEQKEILMKAPGIGKKTGERIILELKDKISKYEFDENIELDEVETIKNNDDSPALEALLTLGYNSYESKKALEKVDSSLDISSKIKEALKLLGR